MNICALITQMTHLPIESEVTILDLEQIIVRAFEAIGPNLGEVQTPRDTPTQSMTQSPRQSPRHTDRQSLRPRRLFE